jgi:hypothetical protein
MGDPKETRDVLLRLTFFLKKYKPEHIYIYHNVALPFPEYLREVKFDAIVFDVTVMALRFPYQKRYFKKFLNAFCFLQNISSVKIAFPQDEYDCHKILDEWLSSWNIDVIFSPLADNQHIGLIYTSYKDRGIIKHGFTGYIDDFHINITNNSIPFELRPIDLGYRARKLPPYFGRIGEMKWRIAHELSVLLTKHTNFKTDISCEYSDVLLGEAWYDFLKNCKFVFGSLSGSSLLDPDGTIQEKVRGYCSLHPNYKFEEVERLFFPNQDIYFFTAISPRNIEAAFTKTGQILVKGPYSGLLEPWEHYIPLEADLSNFEEVINAMKDEKFSKKMIERCYNRISSQDRLYYKELADTVIKLIHDLRKSEGTGPHIMAQLAMRYEKEMRLRYKVFYLQCRLNNYLRRFLAINPHLYKAAQHIHRKLFW